MQRINRLLTWPVLMLVLMTASALAATDIPSPDTDAAAWAKLLWAAVTSKAWEPVVGLVLVGLTYPLRRWAGALWSWFKTPFGGMALNLAIALSGTLGAAFAVSAPITLALFATALSTSAASAGIWEWLKDHLPGVQAEKNSSASAA